MFKKSLINFLAKLAIFISLLQVWYRLHVSSDLVYLLYLVLYLFQSFRKVRSIILSREGSCSLIVVGFDLVFNVYCNLVNVSLLLLYCRCCVRLCRTEKEKWIVAYLYSKMVTIFFKIILFPHVFRRTHTPPPLENYIYIICKI